MHRPSTMAGKALQGFPGGCRQKALETKGILLMTQSGGKIFFLSSGGLKIFHLSHFDESNPTLTIQARTGMGEGHGRNKTKISLSRSQRQQSNSLIQGEKTQKKVGRELRSLENINCTFKFDFQFCLLVRR